MTQRVTIFEMAPRDGLQNESDTVPTQQKIALVDRLSKCGFSKIEVSSFVSPSWVPQLADSAQVFAGIKRYPGIHYTALVPNLRGFEAALAAKADEVAVFASASEGFSQRNINCSVAESLDRFRPVASAAQVEEIPLRGYISCITDCPFDGPTPPRSVVELALELLELGCYEVSLGDTIGKATPEKIGNLLDCVLPAIASDRLAGHFHDTGGLALANISVALEHGLRTFDASVAGLGGCPYAPGAKGNVDTLQVAELLADRGFQTGLEMKALRSTAEFAGSLRSETNEI